MNDRILIRVTGLGEGMILDAPRRLIVPRRIRNDRGELIATIAPRFRGGGGFTPAAPGLVDVAISTRAAAADYTAGRAAQLDKLAIIAAGGAGELTPARAAALAILGAGGAGELTVARAAALDRLINDMTAARAANLDGTVSGILTTIVNSIQRGTISTSGSAASATITSVNTARAFVRWLGTSWRSGIDQTRCACLLTLANATTVTATPTGGSATVITAWEVFEAK